MAFASVLLPFEPAGQALLVSIQFGDAACDAGPFVHTGPIGTGTAFRCAAEVMSDVQDAYGGR
jgi:hypothetical protein